MPSPKPNFRRCWPYTLDIHRCSRAQFHEIQIDYLSILLTVFQSAVANAGSLFDEAKWSILPSDMEEI
jgi:hypothetical protein